MKKSSVFVLFAALTLLGCKQNTTENQEVVAEPMETAMNTEASFGVRGNCEMCKKTIETAALSVEGVVSADWSVEAKNIKVSFDAARTNLEAIHQAIAASGYDTDQVMGSDEAYKSNPACCQYDRTMEMSAQGQAPVQIQE
jgi:mercuric ion binding protein